MNASFGFKFSPLPMGPTKGPNDPAAEHFKGAMEDSVARETVQNSLDVRVDERTVVVEFELRSIWTDDVPDIDTIRQAIRYSFQTHEGSQGARVLQQALEDLDEPRLFVLRIGDYNTTGLTGSESQNEFRTPLSALTRGVGVSSADANRGGSFGIGSIVGPAASTIRTVLYTSMTQTSSDVVFAGHCLASRFHEGGV